MPLQNFGLVDVLPSGNALYRSGQIRPETLPLLDRLRIKTIIKLNSENQDEVEWARPKVEYKPLPSSGEFSVEYVMYLVGFVRGRLTLGNTLVHCQWGRHRAGLIIAAYRIFNNGWSLKDAKHERDLSETPGIPDPPFDEDKLLAEFAEFAKHANA